MRFIVYKIWVYIMSHFQAMSGEISQIYKDL
jgi:hypothetical protein